MSEISTLFENEPRNLARVTLAIEAAIALSYAEDRTRMTGAETKRRFELCVKIFEALRGDLQWGVERIIDHLSIYLRCELDGDPWEPAQHSIWTP